jgi:hypothetical protein
LRSYLKVCSGKEILVGCYLELNDQVKWWWVGMVRGRAPREDMLVAIATIASFPSMCGVVRVVVASNDFTVHSPVCKAVVSSIQQSTYGLGPQSQFDLLAILHTFDHVLYHAVV